MKNKKLFELNEINAEISYPGNKKRIDIDLNKNKADTNAGIKRDSTESPKIHFNSSVYFLLIANIITIIFAVAQKWNLITLLWIYWGQSVIIGIFNFIRILGLKEFSTQKFKINNKEVNPSHRVRYFVAFFFLIHYGGFHLVYASFLTFFSFGFVQRIIGETTPSINFMAILIGIVIFFVNHLFSMIINLKADSKKVKNIGTMMFFPYARIIPMHLTIIFGGMFINSTFALVLFMSLKTLADLIMHLIEHKV